MCKFACLWLDDVGMLLSRSEIDGMFDERLKTNQIANLLEIYKEEQVHSGNSYAITSRVNILVVREEDNIFLLFFMLVMIIDFKNLTYNINI